MKKRILPLFVGLALLVGSSTVWSVSVAGRGDGPSEISTEKKKGGNGFVRALKAPFRAVGKLFGRGGDDSKPRRLREKDVQRFETAGIVRVTDALNPAPPEPSPDQSASSLIAEARAFLAANRDSEAIARLSHAVAVSPDWGEAHRLLGVAYFRKGLRTLSQHHFKESLRVAPDNAETLNDFGYALYRFGDYEGALKRLKRAAQIAPSNYLYWNNLALAQCRLEKYDDAYKSFARGGGEFKGRVNIAGMLVRAGRDDAAIKHYEAALRLQPLSSHVLQSLIGLYERTGRADKAEAARRSFNETGNAAQAGGGR